VTFYDFPQEPWLHIRTTNPLESVFGGVRLSTDVAKRPRKRENALHLVYKIVKRLSHSCGGRSCGPGLMQMVAAAALFNDGVLVESDGGGGGSLDGVDQSKQFPQLTRLGSCFRHHLAGLARHA